MKGWAPKSHTTHNMQYRIIQKTAAQKLVFLYDEDLMILMGGKSITRAIGRRRPSKLFWANGTKWMLLASNHYRVRPAPYKQQVPVH
jgi:hypothetical protein